MDPEFLLVNLIPTEMPIRLEPKNYWADLTYIGQ